MIDRRKYHEDEVSEIFEIATREGGEALTAPADQEGLTLEQLQEVGREVGITPEKVARAAAMIESRGAPLPRQTSLGAPVSVARVVELPRAPTDDEWQALRTEIRRTFGATGQVPSHGNAQEWTDGNLYAFVEKTAKGHRLRLGASTYPAKEVTALGAIGAMIGVLLLVTAGLDEATFGATFAVLIPAVFAVFGGGLVVFNRLRLTRRADERDRQMEHIAVRARVLLERPASEPGSPV